MSRGLRSPKRAKVSQGHTAKRRRSTLGLSPYQRRLVVESLEPRRLLGGTPPFSQMVVFGDSLSDVGNDASWAGLEGFKTSNGRFTSDPTSTPPSAGTGVWHEILADQLGIAPATTSSTGGQDWAYGGAVTGSGTQDLGIVLGIVHNVGQQISDFFGQAMVFPSNTLYAIWAGGNDLIDAANNAGQTAGIHQFESTAVSAVTNITTYIDQLISNPSSSAKFILWPNLPELDEIPHAQGAYNPNNMDNGYSPSVNAALADAVQTFNTDWALELGQLQRNNPSVTFYGLDVHSLFNEMLNGTYPGYTFSNVTTEAWPDATLGLVTNADTYLFWDGMHPTEKAHQLLGDAAASDIENGPSATLTTPSGTVSGNVSIGYSLASTAEWATCGITAQYSTDGGASWHTATTAGGSGTSGLSVTPSGNAYAYVWNSSADIGASLKSNVLFKITPTDAASVGTPGATSNFAVDDRNPSFQDGATLLSQTIAANTQIAAGQHFTQSWILQNTGTSTWTTGSTGYTLDRVPFNGADPLGAGTQYLTLNNSVGPTSQYTFSVNLTAPTIPGTYEEDWQMYGAATPPALGTSFGPTVSVEIVVPGTAPTNYPPQVGVVTPTGTQSGNVTINYSLFDVESDPCSIQAQYSPNGGTTWYSATSSGGSGTSGLASVPGGSPHSYVWASGTDIGSSNNSNVEFRITPTDVGGTGTAGTTSAFTVNNSVNQQPTVTGVSPTSGVATGGTPVSITGTNFVGTPTVKFGSVAATVNWYTTTQIAVYSPAGSGTVDVTVTTTDGTSATSSADKFSYTAALVAPITNALGSGDTSPSGPVLANNQPTFTWNGASGATGGYVLVITDLTTNAIYGYDPAAGTTSFAMPANTLPSGHAFEWSMESVTGSFYSSPSPLRYFQTPPPVGTPEIEVEGWNGGTAGYIFNGQSGGWGTYFGSAAQNSTPPTETFTVENTGTGTLTIGSLSAPSGFTVTVPLPSSIAQGTSANFAVQMSTANGGMLSGNITFTSNAAASPFSFAISGAVTFAGTATTTTVLSASPTSSTYGQPVALTATVALLPSGSATPNGGTVTFLDGGIPLGTATVSGGIATISTTALQGGLQQLTAVYSGYSSQFPGSTSSMMTTFEGGSDGSEPSDVAIDSSGDVYIADMGDSCVREVVAATGAVITVAGNGSAGYNGDNIPATTASLNGPRGVALDGKGHLFIADSGNNRIREVDLSTSLISTVVGNGTAGFFDGPAASAELSYPWRIALDGNGDIFIADWGNGRVREYIASTKTITTVAGGGTAGGSSGDGGSPTAAKLYGPIGVALSNGKLFIAEYGGNRIREVDFSANKITTVAGTGSAVWVGDNIPATTASFNYPTDVTVDNNGNLIFVASGSLRVCKVDMSSGILTTVVGNGYCGTTDGGSPLGSQLWSPDGLAVAGNGNLYVADNARGVRVVRPSLPIGVTPATLTVTPNTASRFYGGSDPTPTATITGFQNGETPTTSGVSGSPILTSTDIATSPVGTYPITASLGTLAANNYTFTFASGTLNITPASLTASVTIGNKIYDGTTAAAISGRSLTGVIGSDVVSLTGGTANFADKNVGTGKTVTITGLSLSGAAAGNYIVDPTATTTASITPAPLTPIVAVGNKVYDGATAATITGLLLDGVMRLDNVSLTGGTAAFTDPNARTGKVVTATGLALAGTDAGDYVVDSTATTTANITPALLTVTADSKSRVCGAVNPSLTYTFSGFVGGDTSSVISGVPSLSTTATSTSVPAVYPVSITANTLAANNYTFNLVAGSLTVTQATTGTVVTSNNGSSTYGQSVTFTATVTPASGSGPTGTVQFQIDGSNVGSPVTISGGTASYSTSTLAAGGHSVVAVYSGDGNFSGSTSAAFAQTVLAPPDVRLVITDTPSTVLTQMTAPLSQAELDIVENHPFYGEIWVESNTSNPANIAGGSVNLSFNPAYGQIVSVDDTANGMWTSFNDGTIDNVAGTLTGLTRTATTPTDGASDWVLFARVQFSGFAPKDKVGHVFGPYDTGLTLTQDAFTVSGSSVPGTVVADTAKIYPVIYDVDDSGVVNGGDFSYFASAYRGTVGSTEDPVTGPFYTWADFDGSGRVNGGDFSWFAGVYRMHDSQIDFSLLPPNYRPANWVSGASVRNPIGSGSAQLASAAVTTTNQASVVATPTSSSPNLVTGTSASLSVPGGDDTGKANLTYTWTATTLPSGAAVPTFSINASRAAEATMATFSHAGTYGLTATTTAPNGLSLSSNVGVAVSQTLTSIKVSPASAMLYESQAQQFTAIGYDQFGIALASQPIFAWAKASGVGSVSTTGLYTAPGVAGSASITVTSGSVVGSAAMIVHNPVPVVAVPPAKASPLAVPQPKVAASSVFALAATPASQAAADQWFAQFASPTAPAVVQTVVQPTVAAKPQPSPSNSVVTNNPTNRLVVGPLPVASKKAPASVLYGNPLAFAFGLDPGVVDILAKAQVKLTKGQS